MSATSADSSEAGVARDGMVWAMSWKDLRETVEAAPGHGRPTVAVLSATSDHDTGRMLRLNATQLTSVGRSPDCTFVLDEPSVSGLHAEVSWVADCFVLRDRGSTNGTYVNGEKLDGPHVLQNGDAIRLGPRVVLRFQVLDDDEQRALTELYRAAVYDGLTGVYNRRHLNERMEAEVAYARRHNSELTLALFDLDRFKAINDTYGHLAGDAVLKSVATTLASSLRAEDVLARYGGEEFAVLLRGAHPESVLAVAERLRQAIGAAIVPWTADQQAVSLQVTASAGVASLSECGHSEPEQLLQLADARLYRAKHEGRDRIIASD